jgi:hypothetical protein
MMPKGVAAKECAERRTLLRPVGGDMVRTCLFTYFKAYSAKTLKRLTRFRENSGHATSDGKEYINIFIYIFRFFVCSEI